MRVIGRVYKGRKIKVPTTELRPTSDKIKKALFNIIRERISGSYFLDLYAGTGRVGLEALSHGARRVIFVESNPSYRKIIEGHISSSGLEKKVEIVASDGVSFLEKAIKKGERFDILFLDPPYHTAEIDRILKTLSKESPLSEGGVLIAEHFKKKWLPEEAGDLRLKKAYRYGDTVLTFYEKDSDLSRDI